MKKNILIIATVFFLAFIFVAPVTAENVLRWASQGDAVTFDPHSANISPTFLQLKQVYEPLLSFDWKIDKEPYLAESWKLLDPTTWEFKIRRGVTFHDGTPLTEPLGQALLTEDDRVAYPVQDDIPVLLEDEAIVGSMDDEAEM